MWESSIWTLIADRHPRTPPRVFSVDVYIKAQQASAFSLLSLCISAKIMHMCNFFPPLPIQIKAPSGFHRSEVKVQFPTRVLVRRRSIHLGGGRRPLLQLIAVGNLWGWPVSRAPETNDVRPLIGCLQRRRRQLARADRWDAEQDPQGDGRAGEPWRGGGGGERWWRHGGSGGGIPKQRGGGHGEGLLMSKETVPCWRSLRGLLNNNLRGHRSSGGIQRTTLDHQCYSVKISARKVP